MQKIQALFFFIGPLFGPYLINTRLDVLVVLIVQLCHRSQVICQVPFVFMYFKAPM